jgi:NAD(P)-dependent dehydrogenase (short-subunit alcohol dehydrogenase family)
MRSLSENSPPKVVVITGASSGIGRATARRFGREGWRVALLARDHEGLQAARREIDYAGGNALVIPTDVADHRQVEAAAERVEQTWGAIDVWINCAMATVYSEFVDITPEEFIRATEVTYLGAVWGTRSALARMRSRNRGTIVQVGSALAYRSIPLQAPYCGAKSALRGFTDSLRSELIHERSRIHVTMVQLSAFNTPQFDWGRTHLNREPRPLPPVYQPEIAANAIFYAATHRRRELWVGLPAVRAILATRFMPGFLDFLLAKIGYRGQHTDQRVTPGRIDNLFVRVPGDHGARGRFDEQARSTSMQVWAITHPVAAVTMAVAAVALFRRMLSTEKRR